MKKKTETLRKIGLIANFDKAASRAVVVRAAALIAQDGVLTHPGYFFDLRGGTFLVVSLLPRPEVFGTAIARLVARVDASLR